MNILISNGFCPSNTGWGSFTPIKCDLQIQRHDYEYATTTKQVKVEVFTGTTYITRTLTEPETVTVKNVNWGNCGLIVVTGTSAGSTGLSTDTVSVNDTVNGTLSNYFGAMITKSNKYYGYGVSFGLENKTGNGAIKVFIGLNN